MTTETTTAIRSRVPWDEYTALRGVSITRLKEIARSPQHYRHLKDHPRTSPAMTLGSAAHVAILEPERFDRDHAIWGTDPDDVPIRRGKAWDAFQAEHANRRILTIKELGTTLGMRDAVRGNPLAMRYLAEGDPEVTLQWDTRGRQCKGRLDWLVEIESRPVCVGLKTTRDCRHYAFASQAAKLGYHLQWAFYSDGFRAVTGRDHRVVEIVVEQLPPHAVAVYVIDEDILAQGREEYEKCLVTLAECEASKTWPGPVPVEETLSLPSWIYGSQDDDVSELGLEA